MILFSLFITLFIIIALSFVLIPLWRKPNVIINDDSETNIQVAKNAMQRLDNDLENNLITMEQHAVLKNELLVNLKHDLEKNDLHVIDDKKGQWLAIPIVICIPLLALALYSVKGHWQAIDNVIPNMRDISANPTDKDINNMVEKLAKRMKNDPSDPKGWMMLARSYKMLKRYPQAVEAMRMARTLLGDDPDVLLQLADIIAVQNGGVLQGEPTALIEQALSLDANNDTGLWLDGLAKAEAGKFNEAIISWQKFQSHYRPEDPDYQETQRFINQAKEAIK